MCPRTIKLQRNYFRPGYSKHFGQVRVLNDPDGLQFTFISDDQDASHLPAWVKSAKQTTDGHLAHLARVNGAVLATLDSGIPGAYLIAAQKLKS